MKKIWVGVLILIALTVVLIVVWKTHEAQNYDVDAPIESNLEVQIDDATNKMYANMQGDEFDKAYLVDMIGHHQGALNMASRVFELSDEEELHILANKILSSQSVEVRQMISWQEEWNYLDENNSDPHAGHAMESSGTMSEDMADMEARLDGLSGQSYDKEFLIQMIRHHQQAVDMSKYAFVNAKHQELKNFSQSIIRAQEDEIAHMKGLQSKWGF